MNITVNIVADPDPGWKKSRSRILYPGSEKNIPHLIFENLVSVFGLKIFKFFDADPIWNLLLLLIIIRP